MAIIDIVDIIDNTGTFYEEVIKKNYLEQDWDTMLINTKLLRFNILKTIKDFIIHEKTICIKEFSDKPPMIYDDSEKFKHNNNPEISTDLIIINNAYTLEKVNIEIQKMNVKYNFVLEALNMNDVSLNKWDYFLDDIWFNYGDDNVIYNSKVKKIIIEDIVQVFSNWSDYEKTDIKNMIKSYNVSQGIDIFNRNTYWLEPLKMISKKYWKKYSFVLTINDYDIYNSSNTELLALIADKYFNNGYFDEIVIKMNYFYWFDDFTKIIEWTKKNLKSTLVSYRFDTIFTNGTKNRYFDSNEALLYNDIQRVNSIDEEAMMFKERIPVLLDKMLSNPQTYGFELVGGYFGLEGEVPKVILNSDDFLDYRDYICSTMSMSPFATTNDKFVRIFKNPETNVFVCIKRK